MKYITVILLTLGLNALSGMIDDISETLIFRIIVIGAAALYFAVNIFGDQPEENYYKRRKNN